LRKTNSPTSPIFIVVTLVIIAIAAIWFNYSKRESRVDVLVN
jgi:hypothetical protein